MGELDLAVAVTDGIVLAQCRFEMSVCLDSFFTDFDGIGLNSIGVGPATCSDQECRHIVFAVIAKADMDTPFGCFRRFDRLVGAQRNPQCFQLGFDIL